MKPAANSSNQISRRLFTLLIRAFAVVVALTLILVLVSTAIILFLNIQNNVLDRFPMITRLEGYYSANDSWDGVERLYAQKENQNLVGLHAGVLLDAAGIVVLEAGSAQGELVGSAYAFRPTDFTIDLEVDGARIGQLVIDRREIPSIESFIVGVLTPVFLISIFLAILTMLIGLLLLRRVVNPLAEVIAAARAVADGKLATRVAVTGPHDLRALSDSFNQMAAALERSDQARRAMLADVAHELRTPLTVIRGRLEGIIDGIYPPDDSHISPALESTYLLERLVDDLRLLTLAETRQLQFEIRPSNLGDLARQAVDLFHAEAQERQVALLIQSTPADLTVLVDPQRTNQVIGNLLSNALRYVPSGGHIWLELSRSAGSVILTVSDDGPGVPEADLAHIFDRFWRKEKSRSRAAGGSGLGLAIARQLVEAQGGSIQAANRPAGGLRVTLSFPSDSPSP